jgi:hypothetical protein
MSQGDFLSPPKPRRSSGFLGEKPKDCAPFRQRIPLLLERYCGPGPFARLDDVAAAFKELGLGVDYSVAIDFYAALLDAAAAIAGALH